MDSQARRREPPPALARSWSWPLSWSLAWRYVRGRRSRLLTGTTRAAITSTSLGVAAMVIAMALMSGYTEDLEGKLLGSGAAIVAYPLNRGQEPWGYEERWRAVQDLAQVERVEAVVYGQGSVSSPAYPQGLDVTLRGVAPEDDLLQGLDPTSTASGTAGEGAVETRGVDGAVLGSELARKLRVEAGDTVRLVAVGFDGERPSFQYRSLRVRGTFTSGFAEADSHWLVLDRRQVESLGGHQVLYEIRVSRPRQVDDVVTATERLVGDEYLVTDWRQHNRDLFTALRLQKMALFLVLGLIVVVSTFHVASTLVVLVREKIQQLGVLGALGLSPRETQRVFLLCGGFLGAVGVSVGVGLGWGAAWILTTFELVSFDPEVAAIYFISSVPFRVRILDVVAVVGFTLLMTLVASWSSARRAARLEPAAALRYE